MTVRTDILVDFAVSPRIVTVAAPSVSITIQDLHDTLRTIEAYIWNLDDLKLLSSAGKEDLGGGAMVGITTTLQNTKLAFAARSGPGWTLCTIYGGNLVAVDANGASMSPIEPTAYVTVQLTQSSSPTLLDDARLDQIKADTAQIRQIEQGRWKIANNQMIFYDTDGMTPLLTFDLKDATGQPTEENPKERVLA